LAQEANKRAAEENERRKQEEEAGDAGDFMGGGMDPDILAALNDPEVAAALQDCMTNPANMMKYANNPKVMNLLKKFGSAMGGMGGAGGGFPGMAGGFNFGGGASEPPKSDSKPKETFDDGLD
jgi:suppressor of tumorigenicity protein 13